MEEITQIINNEEKLELFFETLYNAIEQDDEPWDKKARELLLLSMRDKNADDFFVALCGYSIKSLLNKMEGEAKSD